MIMNDNIICFVSMCMNNKNHAFSVINNMNLSNKYKKELIYWINTYLDISNLEKIYGNIQLYMKKHIITYKLLLKTIWNL